ncbi:hypothetical protein [Rosistilla oblonga]|uniref:hypothetical protein n=1 Tax=Rosistilla oblonga TaxID=2527990 RepID=UPI003A97A6C9
MKWQRGKGQPRWRPTGTTGSRAIDHGLSWIVASGCGCTKVVFPRDESASGFHSSDQHNMNDLAVSDLCQSSDDRSVDQTATVCETDGVRGAVDLPNAKPVRTC